MKRRTKQEWQELFKQQEQSGLSAAEFCRSNNLCAKYFSKRKWDLRSNTVGKQPSRSFIQVNHPKIKSTPVTIELISGEVQLKLPATISSDWLASLVKALA